MRKLLITTTALSVAMSSVPTLPLIAQTTDEDSAQVCAAGDPACDPAADAEKAARKAQRQAEKAAEAAAAKEARKAEKEAEAAAAKEARQAEKAAAAEAAREAENAAAEAAAAQQAADEAAAKEARRAEKARAAEEAAAKDAADKAAADAAAAAAEAEAASAKAVKEAEAAAAKAAAEADAQSAAAAEAAAAATAKAEKEAKAKAKAEAKAKSDAEAAEQAAAAEKAAAEKAASEKVAEEKAAKGKAKAEDEAKPEEKTDRAEVGDEPAGKTETRAERRARREAEAAAAAAAAATGAATATDAPAKGKPAEKAPEVEQVVDTPVPEAEAVQSLESLLGQPDEATDVAKGEEAAPAVAAAAKGRGGKDRKGKGDQANAESGSQASAGEGEAPVNVETQVVTESDTRTSEQEFDKAPVEVAKGKKSGLSDLEKVGLVALGALAVGTILNQGKQDQRTVVSNSGDRVVVQNPDGSYAVYKDDDAVLRRPGVETRTESYNDGSTRTVVTRADGSEVVTIRDASGRVLKRSAYDRRGIETVLIDDLYREEPIIISELPKPRPDRVTISTSDRDAELRAALAADEAASWGRKFSLRQIRDIQQVRALAPTVEVDSITFDTGSSAIRATEASKLADLGRLMQSTLAQNPANVFLIEGHTDAVGSASSNLLLSDRRAESLALALTEYFGIPPENLVVQGYGESELKVASQGDERANRRVVVRLITPLMRTAELQ